MKIFNEKEYFYTNIKKQLQHIVPGYKIDNIVISIFPLGQFLGYPDFPASGILSLLTTVNSHSSNIGILYARQLLSRTSAPNLTFVIVIHYI